MPVEGEGLRADLLAGLLAGGLRSKILYTKQNSDQCAGKLGQRMLEAYGRARHLYRQVAATGALYARRAALTVAALAAYMPPGSAWTTPQGGFYIWLTLPDGVDTAAPSVAARALKVACVPGRPFYVGGGGTSQIRLSYSRVTDEEIDEGIRRIARGAVSIRAGAVRVGSARPARSRPPGRRIR